MARPDHKLNLEGLPQLGMNQVRSTNTSNANSPSELPAGSGLRYPLGNSLGSSASQAGTGRAGAGSPSKEYGSRLFPKRAREIQQQEGLTPQIWGPPPTGSGHSTPLRETIPESPGSDSFPDFDAAQTMGGSPGFSTSSNSARRARAGTVPSRFPGIGSLNSSQSPGLSKSARPTPSSSPYQAASPLGDQSASTGAASASTAALLSRLRAGSMPQRSGLLGTSSPFGNSVFASNWMAGRERASTLQSIRSSDAPSSPRESPADNDRTLDYLGLVDTPQQGLGSLSRADMEMLRNSSHQNGMPPMTIADLAALNAHNNKNTANRFRSYSVNATETYVDEEEDAYEDPFSAMNNINEAVRRHNLDVQAFANNFAHVNRPRARTAGVLDSPSPRVLRNYVPMPSRLDNSITAADLQSNDGSEYAGIAGGMQAMSLGSKGPFEQGQDANLETPTRALWLGNVPSSTTRSSLEVIFSQFGTIEFARVLTHKSCGFVNFDNVQSAIKAKAQYNGKEIFPGCGPIRVGFAKEQSASNTPGANGAYPSPSPDPFVSKNRLEGKNGIASQPSNSINADTAAAALITPDLSELRDEIQDIVQQFGANPEDQARIAATLDSAMSNADYAVDIAPIPEASHNRVHDAPRLREIRKRIDNNSCTQAEIENIAMEMLPEIAELSSDYLGNTVVQKLFEHCTDDVKLAMLTEIAPHLAEIGVHKNGTWAAQKIIDVAQTNEQMGRIVNALRPHGVNLFLDQYGNYVIQCCLRFNTPMNNFIFDTMLNRLWEVSQGRFGARAMRACLESHFATNDQKRLMAAAIALHSVQLATNSNGALLLTWFLDTCTFPRRRSVLAPRLIPHLVHLCTHKVAYLTVLKIINQRNEADARDSVLRALFFDEQTLTDIVSDQGCGATLIFKVLTTPFLDDSIRPECVENVRNVLIRLKAQPSQGYKRLMDEVNLSTRHSAPPADDAGRSHSKTRQANGHLPSMDASQNGYARAGYQGMASQHSMEQGNLQRNVSIDSNSFDAYNVGMSQYAHSPALSAAGMSNVPYPQNMLQAQGQVSRPPGFFPNPAGMGGMQYAAGSPVDPYRQNMSPSPVVSLGMGMQGGFQQGGFGNAMMNGYGQYQMPQYYPQGQMHGQTNGQRRGRR